jgi:hypothetical protein
LTLDHPDRALTKRIMDGRGRPHVPRSAIGTHDIRQAGAAGLRQVRLAVDVFQDTKLEPYTHAMLRRRAENAIRLGLASPRAAAGWIAAIERLAARGQFAFTLNYYAARGMKPRE